MYTALLIFIFTEYVCIILLFVYVYNKLNLQIKYIQIQGESIEGFDCYYFH